MSLETTRRPKPWPDGLLVVSPRASSLKRELLGLSKHGLEDRIHSVLQEVGMSASGDRALGTYSKGMLQRVALAQALLGEPEILILDEPMSGLDPVGRRQVRDIILRQASSGVTVFFSSHIIPDVEALCDRVAIIVDGTVRAIGAVRDLVSREAERYEATFTGADPHELTTPLLSQHSGSGQSWVRILSEHRGALIDELEERGAELVSLNPVGVTLEDLVMSHYEGSDS